MTVILADDMTVREVVDYSNHPNAYTVPEGEPSPPIGTVLTKKQFDKLSGWSDLQNSDKTSAGLIEDLYDYINTGTASDGLTEWVAKKKAAREKYTANRSRT